MPKSLAEMADEVLEVNKLNGWRPSNNTFGDEVALLHSEVSEALEAFRNWGLADVTGVACAQEHGLSQTEPHTCKPEGVGSEFADVLIRLLDTTKALGIDLEAEYERKIAHNRVRGWRHGNKQL